MSSRKNRKCLYCGESSIRKYCLHKNCEKAHKALCRQFPYLNPNKHVVWTYCENCGKPFPTTSNSKRKRCMREKCQYVPEGQAKDAGFERSIMRETDNELKTLKNVIAQEKMLNPELADKIIRKVTEIARDMRTQEYKKICSKPSGVDYECHVKI